MKLIAIPLTVIFYTIYGLALGIMHLVQWLTYNLSGYQAHHNSVKFLDWILIQNTRVLGTTYSFSGREKLPKDVPLIFVSNHQSMFDVSPLEWYLESFHPKFISKIELGKNIPSVSYNLKKGGSVLIDRKDSRQSLSEIKKLSEYIEKYKRSAIIFPEGTRSRDGKLKTFKDNGIRILLKYSPSALIVPITINNSWKIAKNGAFPLSLGAKFTLEVHEPISPKAYDFEDLMIKIKEVVQSGLKD
ncbi:MAG: lysophospholipid acyltransferase family protein [Weeksellaceae bacterium]|nr:lysophospholipid acyltransferase family protein [Weeksellaceae bacterium]